MKISKGLWLTKGGYVVEIDDNLFATIETSPGTIIFGLTSQETAALRGDNKYTGWLYNNKDKGWLYDTYGQVCLGNEWADKLEIIEKFLFEIPTPPKGYQHKDGYPQFRPAKPDEYSLLASCGFVIQNISRDNTMHSFWIVEPVPKYTVCINGTDYKADFGSTGNLTVSLSNAITYGGSVFTGFLVGGGGGGGAGSTNTGTESGTRVTSSKKQVAVAYAGLIALLSGLSGISGLIYSLLTK